MRKILIGKSMKYTILILLFSFQMSLGRSIKDLISVEQYNQMFPHANHYAQSDKFGFDKHPKKKNLFDAKYFFKAASLYKLFCNEGSIDTRKRELAAFLANTSHETTGGWGSYIPGTNEYENDGRRYEWGFCFPRQLAYFPGSGEPTDVCSDYSKRYQKYKPIKGISYHGRGPIQLSWNYNYGRFSADELGDKKILLKNPDKILEDGVMFFRSAIWFWMTEELNYDKGLYKKPSCHDVMVGNWSPVDKLLNEYNILEGFPFTINIINGGIECGIDRASAASANDRLGFYLRYCEILGVEPFDPKWKGYDKKEYSFIYWNESSQIHKQLNAHYQVPCDQHYKDYGDCTLKGVLKHKGKPLKRYHIKLYNKYGEFYEQTTTNSKGEFKIEDIIAGKYKLHIFKYRKRKFKSTPKIIIKKKMKAVKINISK